MRSSFLLRIVSYALLLSLLGGALWFSMTTEHGNASYSVAEYVTPTEVEISPAVVRSIPRLAEVPTPKTTARIPNTVKATLPVPAPVSSEHKEPTPVINEPTQPVAEEKKKPTLQQASASTKELLSEEVIQPSTEVTQPTFGERTVHPDPKDAPTLAKALRTRIPHLTIKGEGHVSAAETTWRLAQIEHILRFFPEQHIASLQYLTLTMEAEAPRGLGGSHTIIIRGVNVSDDEFASVFIHELGHIVDLGYLLGNGSGVDTNFMDGHIAVGLDDPSRVYYTISWNTTDTQYPSTTSHDFITGYAKSDPFEDFAESFTFYILHGVTFRQLAQSNEALQQKYDHLRTYVFEGREFTTGTIGISTAERTWDSTKLPLIKQITIK